MMPNFFVIGPARCATESLYSYLKQHPQVYMSPTKETNWFVFYGNPIPYCGPGDQRQLQSCYVPTLAEYEAQFPEAHGEIALGEASPWYIYDPLVPERISRDLPHAKLITILRNPVDRAYSAYGMLRLERREPVNDFLAACNLEQQRIDSLWEPLWHYKSMGMYYGQIKRYLQHFEAEQLKVYLYDDFNADPGGVMRDIFRFLCVDDQFRPDMSVRLNQSYVPKNSCVHALLSEPALVRSALKPVVPRVVRERLKMPVLAAASGRASIDPLVRHMLVNYFRDDILRLQDLLQQDLSAWLRC